MQKFDQYGRPIQDYIQKEKPINHYEQNQRQNNMNFDPHVNGVYPKM
jgi:hypothetical protein